jgi:hypothetical protein
VLGLDLLGLLSGEGHQEETLGAIDDNSKVLPVKDRFSLIIRHKIYKMCLFWLKENEVED